MTVFTVTVSKAFLSEKLSVRAYVKLNDGTYKYSEIRKTSVFNVADSLYQRSKMVTEEFHNYLYNEILKVVDPTYEKVEYGWSVVVE